MRFLQNTIYRNLSPETYSTYPEKYNCLLPADSGNYLICDCWIVDEFGNVDPDYNVSPVPTHYKNLGEVVEPNAELIGVDKSNYWDNKFHPNEFDFLDNDDKDSGNEEETWDDLENSVGEIYG
ncbi:MAG TPA: hypothetical protein PLP33_29180 [Leptospiraceae bacterium]|nr:hypothetical protein [Leptospiraceae bacterium]